MASFKRFIAGAVCPRCQMIDKLYVLKGEADENGERKVSRHCVRCGFSDQLAGESKDEGWQAIKLGGSSDADISKE